MTIIKHVITVTVLRDAAAEGGERAIPIEDFYLSDIASNITDGPWLGQMAVISTEIVDPDKVEAECIALGNDGEFFNPDVYPILKRRGALAQDDIRGEFFDGVEWRVNPAGA